MNVLISGGGTGGHIFPALSIADAIKKRHPHANILFVGALNRMEMERVPAAGYPIEGLPVAGIDRRRLWRNFSVAAKLWRSMTMARHIIKRFHPDIAIGVGGYASGPTLRAAQSAGVPTLLQEQNSYAGVTNKLLARRATSICTAYPGMERFFPKRKIQLTGNPVRSAILGCELSQKEAKKALGFDPEKPLVLSLGGSLGALTVNEAIAAALPEFVKAGASLLWQTGKGYAKKYAETAAKYASEGVKATAFVTDMATAYRAADIVVSRAGAGTISELELLGKAAILVPSPNVAEDHQRRNAEALASRGAAVMVLDADARRNLAPELLKLLADPARREALGKEAAKMALAGSADRIADIVDLIISKQASKAKK